MPSLVKKPKAIFGGVVVATAGDLGNGYEEAKLSPWMKHHGGRFSADFDEFVTHLIATKEQYKKSGTRVREAKKRKTIEILTMDWLEFSMMQGKKLSTEKYSLRKQQKQTNAKKRRTEQAAKGIQQGEKFINENLYHPYTDSTFFRYNVTLINPATRGRYELTLFESNGEPRLYHTAAKYYKTSGAVPLFWRPSETPGSFEREFKNFKICFIKKTGVAWDDRMKEFGLKGKGKAGKRGDFQYIPPTAEKPVGLVNGEEWAGSARSIFGNDKKQANPGGGMETPPAGVEGNSTVVENVLTYLKGFVDDNKKDPVSAATVEEAGSSQTLTPSPDGKASTPKMSSIPKKAFAPQIPSGPKKSSRPKNAFHAAKATAKQIKAAKEKVTKGARIPAKRPGADLGSDAGMEIGAIKKRTAPQKKLVKGKAMALYVEVDNDADVEDEHEWAHVDEARVDKDAGIRDLLEMKVDSDDDVASRDSGYWSCSS